MSKTGFFPFEVMWVPVCVCVCVCVCLCVCACVCTLLIYQQGLLMGLWFCIIHANICSGLCFSAASVCDCVCLCVLDAPVCQGNKTHNRGQLWVCFLIPLYQVKHTTPDAHSTWSHIPRCTTYPILSYHPSCPFVPPHHLTWQGWVAG